VAQGARVNRLVVPTIVFTPRRSPGWAGSARNVMSTVCGCARASSRLWRRLVTTAGEDWRKLGWDDPSSHWWAMLPARSLSNRSFRRATGAWGWGTL